MTFSSREVSALLADHGIAPSKRRGQNFVIDPNTVRHIAELAGVGPGDRVVEIGAGVGCLTLALLERGAVVTAIEIDSGLVGVLGEVLAGKDVTLLHADALELDWTALLGTNAYKLVANLPYNVATPLVMQLLDNVPQISEMLVMVQLEAALRFCAQPGSKDYSSVSVRTQRFATTELVAKIGPNVFMPRPRVESALVRISRRSETLFGSSKTFSALVRAGFGQRRKMLRRSLSGLASIEQLEGAHVAPTARAEELTVLDWGRLAEICDEAQK